MGTDYKISRARVLWNRLTDCKTADVHGLTIYTGRRGLTLGVRKALWRETYEEAEAILAERHIRPDDVVLEIGGGIGLVSLLLARRAGRVTTFEANPAMSEMIERNFKLNGLTPDLRMRAITRDGRDLTFYADANIVSSSMVDREKGVVPITVPSTPLAEALTAEGANVLVMDVEGAETELLPDADLSGLRLVIAELHPHIIGREAVEGLVEQMAAKGLPEVERRDLTHVFERPAESR